ncbi:MAG: HPr family phosphocarrier protein [Anaerolineales bacterium]|nr:HPr family phosphocarrier protein [Anaerolineales bacterium]
MEKVRLTVNHSVGLHARPAAQFVKTANTYEANITVSNLTKKSDPVDAKSILSVLTLGVHQGYEIEITADGSDANQALEALTALVENNFGE